MRPARRQSFALSYFPLVAFGLFIVGLYYSTGIRLSFRPDSGGFLGQAFSILEPRSYFRPDGRSFGYPFFLATSLRLPWPALAVILMQLGLVAATYWALHAHFAHLRRLLDCEGCDSRVESRRYISVFLLGTATYGALHVFAASIDATIVFACIAGVATIVVGRFVADSGRADVGLWLGVAVSAVAALNLVVKPHWLFVAPALSIVIGLAWATAGPAETVMPNSRWLLRLAAPCLVMGAVYAPDFVLSKAVNSSEERVFGAQSLFCNHLHLVDDIAFRNPDFRIHEDAQVDSVVRAYMSHARATYADPDYPSRWEVLGFYGDLCMYVDPVHEVLDPAMSADARRDLYLGAVVGAVRQEPWPFVQKVVEQVWWGFRIAFSDSARCGEFDQNAYALSVEVERLPTNFLAGIRRGGEVGALACDPDLMASPGGRLVQAMLGVVFSAIGAWFGLLVLAAVCCSTWRWRSWNRERRRVFLGYVLVPLLVIVAHHALVGVVHTFDISRYAFNTFFVSVLFVGTATVFLADEWLRIRGRGRTRTTTGT